MAPSVDGAFIVVLTHVVQAVAKLEHHWVVKGGYVQS